MPPYLCRTERKQVRLLCWAVHLKNMKLYKIDGAENSYNDVNELFSTARSVRNDYFGSYLMEGEVKPSELLKKIDDKMKKFKTYLSNLQTLRADAVKLNADEEAKKLQETIKNMSIEQAQALMEQLKARVPD